MSDPVVVPGCSAGPGRFPVVALVASTSDPDVMTQVLGRLPADFPAAVLALQHLAPEPANRFVEILDRCTGLQVRGVEDGARLEPGLVLVPPEGKHLLIGADERVRLIDIGARGYPYRPSADLLLATLAVALGPRVLAVVLTWQDEDGTIGAQAVHHYGGRVLVQDRESYVALGLPAAAMLAESPSPPLQPPDIAAALVELLQP